PAPVLSRSSLTIAAVILAISSSYRRCGTARHRSARPHHVPDIIMPPKRHGIATRSLGLDQGAGERHPAVALDAAVELELGIELGDVGLAHGGDLPVVEDAGLVQGLLELRTDARDLRQIVGSAARSVEQLEGLARLLGLSRQVLDERSLGGADVDAEVALAARDAVDRRAGDEVAVERDGTTRVIVGRHRIGDAVGIAVRVD